MSERRRARQVAVIGSGGCGEETEAWRLAEEVGRLLAEAGATVVALRSWSVSGRKEMEGGPGIVPVEAPEQAVTAVLTALGPSAATDVPVFRCPYGPLRTGTSRPECAEGEDGEGMGPG